MSSILERFWKPGHQGPCQELGDRGTAAEPAGLGLVPLAVWTEVRLSTAAASGSISGEATVYHPPNFSEERYERRGWGNNCVRFLKDF